MSDENKLPEISLASVYVPRPKVEISREQKIQVAKTVFECNDKCASFIVDMMDANHGLTNNLAEYTKEYSKVYTENLTIKDQLKNFTQLVDDEESEG